jgi:hypothetical protein
MEEPTREEINEKLGQLAVLLGITHLQRKEEEVDEIDDLVTHIAWKFSIDDGSYLWQVAQIDGRFGAEDGNGYSAYVFQHMRTDYLFDIEEVVKQHTRRRILPSPDTGYIFDVEDVVRL